MDLKSNTGGMVDLARAPAHSKRVLRSRGHGPVIRWIYAVVGAGQSTLKMGAVMQAVYCSTWTACCTHEMPGRTLSRF